MLYLVAHNLPKILYVQIIVISGLKIKWLQWLVLSCFSLVYFLKYIFLIFNTDQHII